ncbi:hypothetical protein SAMN04489724_0999 [Algoriphagus locisalis]|uniref:HEAT repeat-containing protein n=1 Tax=Algoriphagus locisalis TaxID=305507 RepID=A0A1I6YGZ8_9BACT|nr:HEAT repeat domain-containing protein [Algoriphagus locisalis]SFT49621.1 hypothetical protein SAMN04489724_0999 [Algoriphagus locisalis]
MKGKRALLLVFLFFLMIKTEEVLGQEEQVLPDSASFVDFLVNQGEILGLEFYLIDESTGIAVDSVLISNSKIGLFSEYAAALAAKDSLLQSDSVAAAIQFLIYKDQNTYSAALEFVSNLLRNNDILAKTPSNLTDKDLISLANRERYSPSLTGTYAYFGDYKIFAVTIIITLFFIFALAMILFMLIFKARRNRKEVLQTQYDEQVIGPLSEILFEKSLEELESLSDEELHQSFPAKQLKKPLYNQVLVDRILALNKKMKGDFKLKLKALYKRLGLDKVTINKLKSSKWDKVVTGLVEVNEMDLSEALKEVKKHVNSPNFYIRSQAVATVLNLSEHIDLSFLRDQAFPLSRWQQMNYLRIIKYLHANRELNIENLFDSKNQSIRLFGYKLVRLIGRVDLLAHLEEKFANVADEEKIEIIKAFEYLGVPSHTELINASLKSENTQLVTMAAKAAGSIGDELSARIILDLLAENPKFRLKMTLLKSLQSLDQASYIGFVKADSTADTQTINSHLSDPLLADV